MLQNEPVCPRQPQNRAENEPEYFNYLHFKQVDGVILLTSRSDPEVLKKLSNNYPGVLASEYVEGAQIPTVAIDNVSSARTIPEHLINLGDRRIAHITGPLDVVLGRDRLKGYRQSILQNDLEVAQALVQEGDQ